MSLSTAIAKVALSRLSAPDFELCLPPLPAEFKWVIPGMHSATICVRRVFCEFKQANPTRRIYLSCYVDHTNELGNETEFSGISLPYIEYYAIGFQASPERTLRDWTEPGRIIITPGSSSSAFEAQKTFDTVVEEFCQDVQRFVILPPTQF